MIRPYFRVRLDTFGAALGFNSKLKVSNMQGIMSHHKEPSIQKVFNLYLDIIDFACPKAK